MQEKEKEEGLFFSRFNPSLKNNSYLLSIHGGMASNDSNPLSNPLASSTPDANVHHPSTAISSDTVANQIITPELALAPAQAPAPAPAPAQKKLRVIVGLPGDHFSQAFLLSWTQAIYTIWNTNKYDIVVSPGKSSFVPFARMHTLGLSVLRGKNQKAFNGEDYDVFVSIDSDVVFTAAQLIELIECTKVHPVVSGYYMMANNKQFAVVRDWSKSHFAEHGTFQFLEPKDVEVQVKRFVEALEERKKAEENKEEVKPLPEPEFQKVSYAGMGFFACTKVVLDSLQYPFFNRELQKMRGKDGAELVDMCSEDVAFCKNIEDAGFDIMLNTRLRVGHEKSVVL